MQLATGQMAPFSRPAADGIVRERPTEIYRRAAVIFAAFVGITATVLGLLLLHLHGNARADAERLGRAFALLAEKQISSRLQAVEWTLELVESRLASAPPVGRREALAGLAKSRPWLVGLFVLEASGRVVAGTDDNAKGRDRFRSYVDQQREGLAAGFAVNLPLPEESTRSIPATLPIRDAEGRLQGFILALVASSLFEQALQHEEQSDYRVELARIDGSVLIQMPIEKAAMSGGSLASDIVQRLAAGDREGAIEIEGADRQVFFRRLAEYPGLVVSVENSARQILGEWRKILWLIVAGWIAGIVAVAFLALWIVRVSVARWAAQRRYRLLFQTNPYAILVVDPQTGRLLTANDAALKQYGWSRDELLVMTMADMSASDGEPDAGSSRNRQPGTVTGPFVHRRKDGSTLHVELSTQPVEFAGRPAVLTIAHDVSERVRLDAARQAAEDKLRQSQKMEAIGQLTGGVAHDLNNILTVILANMDGMQAEAASLAPAVARRVHRVIGAAEQAADLTRQLLAFSRKQPLKPEVIHLGELVARMSQLLVRSLGERITIDIRSAPGVPAVHVDRTQLEAALLNICVNARDAMPEGGKLLIELGEAEFGPDAAAKNEVAPGRYALIAVSDSGTGIPKEAISKIFEPFFTTKDVGKGTGLGLSMVYGFTKQSKGHIEVYSELGRGTTFKIYLPAIAGQDTARRVNAIKTLVGGHERILVVEDEDAVREAIVDQLAGLGYTVEQAAGGAEALAICERQTVPFDVLLTDVVMPGPYSGPTLAEALAEKFPAMRVVFMSGYTRDTIGLRGELEADTRLLSKPFSRLQLAQMIRDALEGPPFAAARAG